MDQPALDSSWTTQPSQTALMWQQQPDYARYKEKSNGEGWLVNQQEGMLLQIKPYAPTQHAQFVLVSYYRLSARLGQPVRQQRMLRHLGIEMWINLQKIGWERCTPPNRLLPKLKPPTAAGITSTREASLRHLIYAPCCVVSP